MDRAILIPMNYAQEQIEYLEWKAELAKEESLSPTDVGEGVYMLVDDASPSEPPKYFHSLESAVGWAEHDYPYSEHGEWSVYKVGNKVL
jgi:hypothetical protein